MKRFFKTLLFTMLLFISTNVMALDGAYISTGLNPKFNDNGNILAFSGMNLRHVEQSGYEDAYSFCLDSEYSIAMGTFYYKATPMSDIGPNSNKIKNIIMWSYVNGLGKEENTYGLPNDELYIVTQMAVWHAAHGDNIANGYNEDSSFNTSGITYRYSSWLGSVGNPRRDALNDLISHSDQSVDKVYLDLEDNHLGFNSNGDYSSKTVRIIGPTNSTYSVSTSDNACIEYNGICSKEQNNIATGEEFILKVHSSSIKSASIRITSANVFNGSYDFSMLTPVDTFGKAFVREDGTNETDMILVSRTGEVYNTPDTKVNAGLQRVAVFDADIKPFELDYEFKSIENTIIPSNDEDSNLIKTVDIKICGLEKCDIESDVIISEITESGSSQIADLKIKNGESYNISVKVGSYYVLRNSIEFPKTEDMAGAKADAIYFKVTEDGVKLCSIKNHDLSTADCDITSDIFKVNGFEISIDNCTDKKEPETVVLVEVPKDTENVESKTIDVPSTGVNTKAYLIGGLVMLLGAGTIVVTKKKENM